MQIWKSKFRDMKYIHPEVWKKIQGQTLVDPNHLGNAKKTREENWPFIKWFSPTESYIDNSVVFLYKKMKIAQLSMSPYDYNEASNLKKIKSRNIIFWYWNSQPYYTTAAHRNRKISNPIVQPKEWNQAWMSASLFILHLYSILQAKYSWWNSTLHLRTEIDTPLFSHK
jgi:hypothetical protein